MRDTRPNFNRGRPVAALLAILLAGLLAFSCAFFAAGSEVAQAHFLAYDEDKLVKDGKVTVDVSNADQGYILVKHSGSSKRLKARVSFGDNVDTYDLNGEGEYEAFPLKYGDGTYKIYVFQNIEGSSYAQVFAKGIKVNVEDDLLAFLYPNQYVMYDSGSAAVAKSAELCANLSTDTEKFDALYAFVSGNIVYDYIKALTVQKGYLPDVDQTLSAQSGICFDQAALLTCMLRVQGVPAKVVIGWNAAGQYHAWNSAYVEGAWISADATVRSAKGALSGYTVEREY